MPRDTEAERRYGRLCESVGEWIIALGEGRGCAGLKDGELTDMRIRFPREDDPEALLIVRASDERGAWVGFVGALDAATALLTWRKRDQGPGLKWVVDRPYER